MQLVLYQSRRQSSQIAAHAESPPLPALSLIRVHRLSSLCARRARSFALTPNPSPTAWERGVGAHGGAPCSAFPLSRRRERGTKGVRAIQRTCWFTLALGKIAPASKTSCRTVVPLPAALSPLVKGGEGRGEGGFESCAFTNFGSAVGMTRRVRMCGSIGVRRSGLVSGGVSWGARARRGHA